jgi:hypothetical protein
VSEKQIYRLVHGQARAGAMAAIKAAPDGFMVTIQPPTRTLEQNARMWAMLSDVSKQVVWHGRKLSPEEWKHVFSAALDKQDVVPGIEGGFVVLGKSTSKMSIREMTALQELMSAFGAERGVQWSEPGLQGYEDLAASARRAA